MFKILNITVNASFSAKFSIGLLVLCVLYATRSAADGRESQVRGTVISKELAFDCREGRKLFRTNITIQDGGKNGFSATVNLRIGEEKVDPFVVWKNIRGLAISRENEGYSNTNFLGSSTDRMGIAETLDYGSQGKLDDLVVVKAALQIRRGSCQVTLPLTFKVERSLADLIRIPGAKELEIEKRTLGCSKYLGSAEFKKHYALAHKAVTNACISSVGGGTPGGIRKAIATGVIDRALGSLLGASELAKSKHRDEQLVLTTLKTPSLGPEIHPSKISVAWNFIFCEGRIDSKMITSNRCFLDALQDEDGLAVIQFAALPRSRYGNSLETILEFGIPDRRFSEKLKISASKKEEKEKAGMDPDALAQFNEKQGETKRIADSGAWRLVEMQGRSIATFSETVRGNEVLPTPEDVLPAPNGMVLESCTKTVCP